MTASGKRVRDRMQAFAGSSTAIVLLLLAVALVYAGSLTDAFVFDDAPAILENPTLRHPGDLAGLLAPPGEQAGTVGGRPILNLSLALNYSLGGDRPLGYHLLNVAIHAAATLLLFGVLRRTLQPESRFRNKWEASSAAQLPWRSPWPWPDGLLIAFFSALFWAVHPLQTEAVTYVVQRAESLMGLFYLLTLYCFIRYSEAQPPLIPARRHSPAGGFWGLLSVLSCFLGMATKEVMVSAPLVVLFYDRTFVAGSLRTAWARRRGLYIGLASSWLLLAILVAGTHGRGGTAGYAPEVFWPYALTQCRAIVHYLRLAFWPAGLVFDYGTALTHGIGDVLPQALLLALLTAGAGYAWHRRSVVGFAAVSFFALIAPSSSIVPIVTEPLAEHRMYLPLAAVSILFTASVFSIFSRLVPNFARIMLCGLGTAVAVGLGLATVRRNLDYGSEIALWSETVRLEPENPRAHNNLAEAYRSAGKPASAAAEFRAAVQADPNYAPAQYNLGVTLLDSGHAAEAIAHLDRALSVPRHLAELNLYLGEALERTGRNAEAVESYREALRLAPVASEAAFGLGNNLAALGRYTEAIEAYRRAVLLAPDNGQIRNNLANALGLLGRVDEAIVEYREALKRDPGNESVRENLGRALKAVETR